MFETILNCQYILLSNMILFANRDGGWVCKPNSVFNFMPMLNNTGKSQEQETKGNFKNVRKKENNGKI